MTKKLILLFLICILSTLSINATVYSGSCGTNVRYSLDTSTGLLSITGTGPMANYSYASSPWYSNRSYVKTVEISDGVTNIGYRAFDDCSGLTSVTIGNSVTSIGDCAFWGCSGLTSITIPNSVTSIEYGAFNNCSKLTSVTIPNSVTSIGSLAFRGCSGLTSVTIGNSVTSIGNDAFRGCSGLTSITIPNSVTSIGNYAFYGCSGLTSISVESGNKKYDSRNNCNAIIETASNTLIIGCKNTTIPNSVTSIGSSAFSGCSGLTSVTIPNSVTSIGYNAFNGCSGLTSVTIPNSVTSIGESAFFDCSKLTSITIPNSVTSIGSSAFNCCSDLASIVVNEGNTIYDSRENCNAIIMTSENLLVSGCKNTTIPNSISHIGEDAFYGSGIASVTIPDKVTEIRKNAFRGCPNLTNVTINSNSIVSDNRTSSTSLKTIFGEQVTNYVIGENITSIGDNAFYGCERLTSVSFPNSVTIIGDKSFYGCTNLGSVTLGDNITSISSNTFPLTATFYTKHKAKTLFSLWRSGTYKKIYEQGTSESLAPPFLNLKENTQTSITFEILNMYSEYTYEYHGEKVTNSTIEVNNMFPEYSNNYYVTVKFNELSYTFYKTFTTKSISPSVISVNKTASSLSVNGKYSKGDAEIAKMTISLNGKKIDGDNISLTGLNPNTSYKATYTITVKTGEYSWNTRDYTASSDIKTDALTLTTQQPKVISLGNVIVSATTNVDPIETNVGFEWRRTDWTDDFASQTGSAILIDGTMEGYIRNLNAEKLWKYRAYYLSDSGTYYYGDWVGIDPSNTSYFEPTVHTYANVNVEGNTALVKGYALGGTDKIIVQGFKYWKTPNVGTNNDLNSDRRLLASTNNVPANASTETVNIVGAGQQLMSATLKGLDYNSTYHYVSFVTTSENETFYGEEQVFTIGVDPTGVEIVDAESNVEQLVTVVARYNLNGVRIDSPQPGINILKMSDGSIKKVFVK